MLPYIIYILTVTVSYGQIYSVYLTQPVEVIGKNSEECGTTQSFIENLNLAMCGLTVGVFDHLEITSTMDVYQRLAYMQRILKASKSVRN